nr:hypothetical protein Iba_chr15cCG9110 [Ipomoea batatas]
MYWDKCGRFGHGLNNCRRLGVRLVTIGVEVTGIIDQGNQNVMTDSMSSNDFVSPPVLVAPPAQLDLPFDDSDNRPVGEEAMATYRSPADGKEYYHAIAFSSQVTPLRILVLN